MATRVGRETMELSSVLYTSMTNVLSHDQVNKKTKDQNKTKQKDCKLVHCDVLFWEKSKEKQNCIILQM